MSGFSADWLALREPFDQAARGAAARTLDLRALARRLRGADAILGVTDLACGTGANLRELAPRLGGAQRWLLVDHDPRLLAALPRTLEAWARAHGFAFHLRDGDGGEWQLEGADWRAEVRPLRVDLATGLGTLPFAGTRLVTASALLDLVSGDWLDALLERVKPARAGVLFALSVDGQVAWTPSAEGDAEIDRLFASHQRRDKGFGAALGGGAMAHLAARLAAMDYEVRQAASDWCIDASEGESAKSMLGEMIKGAGAAALEQDPAAAPRIGAWVERRLSLAGASCLRVGHADVLAFPR